MCTVLSAKVVGEDLVLKKMEKLFLQTTRIHMKRTATVHGTYREIIQVIRFNIVF